MLDGLRWYGHASFRISTSQAEIVVDPYQLKDAAPAQILLITHSHYDHLSEADVAKVRSRQTVVLAPLDCLDRLGPGTSPVEAGQRLDAGLGVIVEAVPAYNLDKQFHPKANGWLGYVIEADGRRIYIAGDTDHIPEMREVRCDVACLPVGGTYTMTADEAAAAVADIQPRVAVPVHWGSIVGGRTDAERFVGLCGQLGRLLEPRP